MNNSINRFVEYIIIKKREKRRKKGKKWQKERFTNALKMMVECTDPL